MIYKELCGEKISMLGLGTMRLPEKDGKIDEEQANRIVSHAYFSGVNYFDTAFRYHKGESEPFIGKALSKFPRESYFLASKLPGHMMNYKDGKLGFQGYLSNFKVDNISEIFEDQLKRCNTPFFDFYLLHNVSESSFDFYTNEELNVVDYLKKQKELGRIHHLGFSAHGSAATIDKFLNKYDCFEFVQIQLNFLDYELQDAKTKYEVIKNHGLPVWVMEPVRGGKLLNVDKATENEMKRLRPNSSVASWSFRFLQSLPDVGVVLSGMSSLPQLNDNLDTFDKLDMLNNEEKTLLKKAADKMMNTAPCTACRYCCEECPVSLDIPGIVSVYNNFINDENYDVKAQLEMLYPDKLPTLCISCGNCKNICPQNIDIPSIMKKMSEHL